MSDYRIHTDQALATMVAEGDEQAFTEVYGRYYDRLARYAYKLTYGDEVAFDLLHDVFANLWNKRHMLKPTYPNALRDYLYTSIRYAVLNSQRKATYHDRNLSDLVQYITVRPAEADTALLHAESQEALDRAIATLPEKMRVVFLLSREEQLSHAEIAERLGISRLTVKTQMHHAIQRLSKQLKFIFIVLFFS